MSHDRTYAIGSRDYLRRARSRLGDGSFEALFYAALELRSGVEARLQEYLDAQHHISERKKKGWQVAKLGRNLEEAFRVGNRIVEITIANDPGRKPLALLYYTPVTKSLQKNAQQLGNYLHSIKQYREPTDPWWREFRAILDSAVAELEVATTGTLLGPPLLHPKTGSATMTTETVEGTDPNELIERIGRTGTQICMKVDYLAALPPRA